MKQNKTILNLIFFLIPIIGFSQTSINGIVKDENNSSLTSAYAVLYENNKIIEYTMSDNKGFFKFDKQLLEGIYLVELTKFGYKKFNQTIVVGTDEKKEIKLEIILDNSNFIELKEVVITSKPPIIVKKDTIIYNIDRLKDVYDDNLEQVLSKIQGFKIQANGEIEVNGKIIRKVLIDGKEVSDFGSSLLTKTLSANDVKEVEVRFDEKNSKLKESLLDDSKFAVLDIKLKDDLNKSFFGNIHSNIGYQNNLKIGGYSNVFSLNEKINIQAFAENTNFGNNKITLDQIRNIGEEASAKIFALPIDYNDIKKREGLNEELYGFNNFTQNDNSIIGMSINFALTKKTDLFIGSFNNYHFMKNQSLTNQYYINDLIRSIDIFNNQKEYNSKNKIQLKHTSDKIKLKSDLNYTWSENSLNNSNKDQYINNFGSKHNSSNVYFNNSFEYLINSSTGLVSNTSFSNENYKLNNNLQTNDSTIANYLGSSISQALYSFSQLSFNTEQNFNTELKLNKKTNWGNHFVGYKYFASLLENEKKSLNTDLENFVFLNPKQKLSYFVNSILYNYQKSIGLFEINTNFELSQITLPNKKTDSNYYFQYNINIVYSLNQTSNIILLASNNLGKLPLEKMTNGLYLSDFQTIFEPSLNLKPVFNTSYSIAYFKILKDLNLELISAILYGNSKNTDNQTYNSNILTQNANQLNSSYVAFSNTITKKFKKFPLKIILEPEILNNKSSFIYNNEIKENISKRYLLGLKIDSKFKRNFDFNYFSKYSKFVFQNNINDFNKRLEFLSNSINIKTNFLNKSLILMSSFRNVYFIENKNNFSFMDISITKKVKNLKYYLILSNILNANKFITNDFNQVIFTTNENTVFSRYINFGIEYKMK